MHTAHISVICLQQRNRAPSTFLVLYYQLYTHLIAPLIASLLLPVCRMLSIQSTWRQVIPL